MVVIDKNGMLTQGCEYEIIKTIDEQ